MPPDSSLLPLSLTRKWQVAKPIPNYLMKLQSKATNKIPPFISQLYYCSTMKQGKPKAWASYQVTELSQQGLSTPKEKNLVPLLCSSLLPSAVVSMRLFLNWLNSPAHQLINWWHVFPQPVFWWVNYLNHLRRGTVHTQPITMQLLRGSCYPAGQQHDDFTPSVPHKTFNRLTRFHLESRAAELLPPSPQSLQEVLTSNPIYSRSACIQLLL